MSPFGEVTLGESLVEPLLLEDVIVCYHTVSMIVLLVITTHANPVISAIRIA